MDMTAAPYVDAPCPSANEAASRTNHVDAVNALSQLLAHFRIIIRHSVISQPPMATLERDLTCAPLSAATSRISILKRLPLSCPSFSCSLAKLKLPTLIPRDLRSHTADLETQAYLLYHVGSTIMLCAQS